VAFYVIKKSIFEDEHYVYATEHSFMLLIYYL